MVSKFLNIDTDDTLAENSDNIVASQKAVKTYVDQQVSNLESQLPSIATNSTAGLVKPDGETIRVSSNGVLTAVGGGGEGTGNNMKYLFGNGQDGEVVVSANTNFGTETNFSRLTINSGVTVSSSTQILIIRCTEECIINGSIDMSGKGLGSDVGYSSDMLWWCGGMRSGGGAGGYSACNPGQPGAGCGGGAGWKSKVMGAAGANGAGMDYQMNMFFAQQLKLDRLLLLGGGGGSYYNQPSSGSATYIAGGTGGGGILILAPIITIGSTAQIISNGTGGVSNTSASSGGGGGGGGGAALIAREINGTPTTSFSGGAGGYGGSNNGNGGSGGPGGLIRVLLP